MSRIGPAFAALREKGAKAFIPFIECGDPDADTTVQLAVEFARRGVTLIELGIPFSDPLMDGPVIQLASSRALAGGMTTRGCLEVARRIREATQVPLIFMGCYNPILRFGPEAFVGEAAAAGVDGLLVTDLPPEETGDFPRLLKEAGLDFIALAAPTTTPERLERICSVASGFIYLISVTGVTGMRDRLPEDLAANVERVKRASGLPVVVGFGTKTPEQAAAVCKVADGAVVGSAIVDFVASRLGNLDRARLVSEAGDFVESFVKAIGGQG